tara:strand:+ start:93 stop:1031 length:939 start_codon:yes stop_codon:yes gene_type:complete
MNQKCHLIIGSTGFIGSSLCKKFKNKENLFTISIDNKVKKENSRNHYKVDIKNFKKLSSIIKRLKFKYNKIIVYFLAGESSVERSISKPFISINDSIIQFHNLAFLLRDHNSIIVFASSGSIYDSRKGSYFNEKDKLYPPSPYAATKYATEGIAMAYYETYGLDIRIARIFSIYGENMRRFFIYDIIKKLILSDGTIFLKGSGNQQRDYLHIDDVVEGLIKISRHGRPGEFYNLCSGRPTKLKKLTSLIQKILNKENIEIIWDKKETKGIRDIWYGNNNKITKLGFKPKKSFEESLESTVKAISKKILISNR